MKILRSLSVRRKITLIIMLVSAVSLALAVSAFILTQRYHARQFAADNLQTMAEIIAANSKAAIIFGDNTAAEETLEFLHDQDHILAAIIYGPEHEQFAVYRKQGAEVDILDLHSAMDNILFWNDHVELVNIISHEGVKVGHIYLRSDFRLIQDHLSWYIIIALLVFFVSLLISFVLSERMQRIITDPLLRLSEIARQITTEKNYTLRLQSGSKDEVGNLISGFNEMLDQIQLRDKELELHRSTLEDLVAKRTAALESANRELEAAKREAEEIADKMEYHAHHDHLTGLPNRSLLLDRIGIALSHAHREQALAGLLFLDLDRFKIINDSLGHAIGDQLLRLVAQRLKSCIREDDTVARLGGDEFMVLLPSMEKTSDAGYIGNRIIDALDEPITCEGYELNITTSIGISIYPYDGNDTDTLIKNADTSMYRAKGLGRNRLVYYTAEMNEESRKRLMLENDLRKALEKQELGLVYQPIVDTQRNVIIGVEALILWNHPTMGTVHPDEFIPLAEDTGLIVPIGEWVIRTAFQKLRELHDAGHLDLRIAVNLSPTQLSRPGLVSIVEHAIDEFQINPYRVDFEITENVAMQNLDTAIVTLEKLKKLGISISLDDFGTGYSSLSHLHNLPIDTIKIGQSFVRNIPDNMGDMSIAQAIIAMANSLDLSLIAEGVENIKQMNFFRQQGVHVIQGHLISMPVPEDQLMEMLKTRSARFPLNIVK
ncbi:MAG: EAL domain-containing protein [Gammaproteobacteria bacterium]|nr:EAL domain-containing protein [Gammaproteobacteria bacterium]